MSKTKFVQRPTKRLYAVTQLGRYYFDSLHERAFQGFFPHFYGFLLALIFNTRQTPKDIQKSAMLYKKTVEYKLDLLANGQVNCRATYSDSQAILSERLSLYLEKRIGLFTAEKDG